MIWAERRLLSCDIFIGVCGYESRSTHALENLVGEPKKCLILDYASSGVLSYNRNKDLISKRSGVEFLPLGSTRWLSRIDALMQTELSSKTGDDSLLDIILDVSSASRKIVSMVLTLISDKFSGKVRLSCIYSVAQFYDPPTSELPSHISEPVIGALAGWSDDLSKPPCAVVGLGFEPGRAIGCLDYLEIPEARLFFPSGPDDKFVAAVEKANFRLISEVGSDFVLPYSIMDPKDTLVKLFSLVTGLEQKFRPIIIPFGPKIFATIGMIVAIQRSPNVCVWRASSGGLAALHDSKAEGAICCLTVIL